MTVIENIDRLIKEANEDMGAANALSNAGYYGHSLFWLHLVLEKLCKALWIKTNNNTRHPYIHNLLRLLKECDLDITGEQAEFYASMNQFQATGRYGDDLHKIEETVNNEIFQTYFQKTNNEIKWLKELLQ